MRESAEEINSGPPRMASLSSGFPIGKAVGETSGRPGLSHVTATAGASQEGEESTHALYAFDPNTWEAKTGRFLYVQDQPGLCGKFQGSRVTKDPVSTNKQK